MGSQDKSYFIGAGSILGAGFTPPRSPYCVLLRSAGLADQTPFPDPPWNLVGQASSGKARILNEEFVMIDGNPANNSALETVPASVANSCGNLIDCHVEAHFIGQTGTSALNPRGGLAARVQTDDGFSMLFDKNTNLALWLNTNITGITRLSSDQTGPSDGQYVGIRCVGDQISITIDGVIIVTVTNTSFATGGLQGWHFHSDTLSSGMFWAFDEFRVTSL